MKNDEIYYYVDFTEGEEDHVSEDSWFVSDSPDEFCNYMQSLGLVFKTRQEAADTAKLMLVVLGVKK